MSAHPVVTGLGVAAPTGLGADEHWAATLAGRGAIGPITAFDAGRYPSALAGEVNGFDAREHLPGRLLPQTDRMTRLALAAAAWAIDDARLRPAEMPEFGMGVVTAGAFGGFEFGQRELEALWKRGPEHVSAYQSFAWFYAVNTGQISIRHGMRGPSGVVVTEQAGGLDAFAMARRQIRRGTPIMVTGGMDSSLCPWGWIAQLANGRVSRSADPRRAYLPFDEAACGYVPGEGGALLVLEDAAAAADRGATVYGAVAGYGATFDPHPRSGRPPGLRRAAETALRDAGLDPGDVDLVLADGAGVPELDRVEAEAITGLFGRGGVPVSVPKTMTGRLYSGGAALDVATALLALRDQRIPPTVNVGRPRAGHGLDLVVDRPREAHLSNVLVLARGLGGFNAALVVRR
ncbi:act minimal PKS chain-length factor (CLF/KS beta) [Streptosporangium becharense]|uniref:Act minimal PKS chain-length factor (CLF/KS beta) n=1 Tax=Streptosporangium becharense TaxID=1816182 RepID=A0A7W9ILW9_9ACTN|nr:ketosynthase chain-length factor [Streptosporangium becharense]MBB2910427.1 act minimal PKS chain-length factor (CLF/KS beta) [Streptosporangium becharense]MBB5823170.1 act minimal PKS chain-length factor (CLF/KS beta) [Streptosporangium becharense]